MSEAVSRICLLLAASDERTSELRIFARWLDHVGPQGFVSAIEHIREAADRVAQAPVAVSARSGQKSDLSNTDRKFPELIAKIESLLFSDARLSRSLAAELLYREISREFGETVNIPSRQRMAFRSWISKVLERFPESAILHVATRIRNSVVDNKSRVDWALSRDKE